MSSKAFSETAWIEIQGECALHFVRRGAEYAEYEVIGYAHQITLRDFRKVGLDAIDEVCNTGVVDKFPYQFNMPALVKILDLETPILSIELHETEDSDPANRLWIAIGTTDLPVYEYIHKRIVPFNDAFALVALYHRTPSTQILSSPDTAAGV